MALGIAFIAPFEMLRQSALSGYHLMLPQYTEHPQYARHFRALKRTLQGNYVILDNGAAENHSSSDFHLLQTADRFGVDEVVAPDILGEAKHTYLRSEKFFIRVGKVTEGLNKKYGYVLQGKSLEECVAHFKTIQDAPWYGLVSVFYIPRLVITASGDKHARVKLASAIARDEHVREIHFLGMHPSYPDEVRTIVSAQIPGVRSLDTSLPYVWAMNNAYIDGVSDSKTRPTFSRPPIYFERTPSLGQRKIAIENCATLVRWANGE